RKRTVEFWTGHGVAPFRVANPHTRPVRFWEWLIREVQTAHPETVFLAEAFTRPKMMKALAKAGFTQSYTYFTWRNEKQELADYLTEITTPPVAEYFRGNLWPNTPDILHETLQGGGPPAFRTRLVLAATLSSLYGFRSEGAGQGRLHAVLHLLHVAQREAGAGRLSDRDHDAAGGRVLPRQPVAQHTRHPARDAAGGRTAGVPDAARAGRHPVLALRHLFGLRARREHALRARLRGVPERREVRAEGPRLERARQPGRRRHADQSDPPRAPRVAALSEP